ncbi:MAG TPA: hypothetical protein VH275_04710 [Solirubrobacterales bacterium]|nr:hypothetical protein [Solirubrobacterales bacterium]
MPALVIGCLGALSGQAAGSPIILPSHHPLSAKRAIMLELMPPQKAKVCAAWIGRRAHTGRRYPIALGGPSRRLSWHISASGHGRWTLTVSCGADESRPESLGTTSRNFKLKQGQGRPHLRVLAGSFRSTRGFLPAHAPRPRRTARSSSISSEADTPAARSCSNPYMSKAYAVGTQFATRIGFTPTKNHVSNVGEIWRDLEACVNFPSFPQSARESMFKQMACANYFGPSPGAGVSWNFDAWHADATSMYNAFTKTDQCDHWLNIPYMEADSDFFGDIVQGSLDTSSQKAAYVIEPASPDHVLWMKSHILTSKAFYCMTPGHPGPFVLPTAFLNEMVTGKGPDIGNEACSQTSPGNTGGSRRVILAQGPTAPSGYRYAISLIGYPPSTGVSVTCYDSVSPQGFSTFVLNTDASGAALTASYCYSGDGPSHWVIAGGVESNHVGWGAASAPLPPPPPQQTWSEQETPNHPVNTFTNYHNASGMGPAIAAGQWVQVSCKVYDPTIASVNPDGYWYRIASSPWNNSYYSPANTFMNGDPYGGPYTHNTDFAVPNC